MTKFVDLFAGIGGFHYALSDDVIGGTCVMAVENNPYCRQVYSSNFGDEGGSTKFEFPSDIRSLTKLSPSKDRPLAQIADLIPDHDLVTAGFPCQPFSKSGEQRGIHDSTRGTLFFDILRVLKAKSPPFLILENVPNLVGPRHRTSTWHVIVTSLRRLGYKVDDEPLVLSPHEIPPSLGGGPQVRRRLFVLAHRSNAPALKSSMLKSELKSTSDNFSPEDWSIDQWLLPTSVSKTHSLREEELLWFQAWQYFVRELPADDLPGFPIWESEFRLRPKFEPNCPEWKRNFLQKNSDFYRKHQRFIDDWRKIEWDSSSMTMTINDFPMSRRKFEWQARRFQPTRKQRDLSKLLLQFRPSGIRVKPPTYIPALVAINQTTVLGSERRRLTPQEVAVIQGFPATVFDRVDIDEKEMYKQIGNAVPVGLARLLATVLLGGSFGSLQEE